MRSALVMGVLMSNALVLLVSAAAPDPKAEPADVKAPPQPVPSVAAALAVASEPALPRSRPVACAPRGCGAADTTGERKDSHGPLSINRASSSFRSTAAMEVVLSACA